MKRNLLVAMLLCGLCLFGCQANSLESQVEDMKEKTPMPYINADDEEYIEQFTTALDSLAKFDELSTYDIDKGIIVAKNEVFIDSYKDVLDINDLRKEAEEHLEGLYKIERDFLDNLDLKNVTLYYEIVDVDSQETLGYYDGETFEWK